MLVIYEKIVFKNGSEKYNEYHYNTKEDAERDFMPPILNKIIEGETVSMLNLVRSGVPGKIKEEGVTFFCGRSI